MAGFELNTLVKERMRGQVLDGFKRGYDVYTMSAGVARKVFEFRPMEAKIIDGKFTIIEEVNELEDFCKEHGLEAVYDAGEYEVRFIKARTTTR